MILGAIEIKAANNLGDKFKILSLDTSTKITGYAVFYDGKLVRYSSIDKSGKKDLTERMAAMTYDLITLIEREAPDVVVVEETVVTRNPQTQRMLTMILGAIFGTCICNNLNYCALRPTQWRKAIRAEDEKLPRKRDDLKAWGIERAKLLFNVGDIDDNISDAILIGKAFMDIKEKKDV